MHERDDVDARLAALRDATEGIFPTAGFADRAVARTLASQAASARPAFLRGWRLALPAAAALAATACVMAWRAHDAADRQRAAQEVVAALGDPEVYLPW